MGSSWQNGDYNRAPDSPASASSARDPPMLEAYKEFAKSGVVLEYCQLPICYNTQPPLVFYLLTGALGSPQGLAAQPKLRLATPFLDTMYQEQERLKADGLKQSCDTQGDVDAAESPGEEVVGDDEEEEQEEIEESDEAESTKTFEDEVELEEAPTFEMCGDGTIVVRNGEQEILLPYHPNMARPMGLGPLSPLEQARRYRLNAACRMSRARASYGATRSYRFKKGATKKPQSEVMDIIEKYEEF